MGAQFFAKQLTLSQPGGQIMPATVLQAPPNFQTLRRPCCVFYNTSHTTTKLTIADFVQAGAFGQKLHFQIFISYVDYSKHS